VIPSSVRIFVCEQPQDMRRSFDGLSAAAREHLDEDPQSGALFVFINRRKNRAKVMWFEENGYCLLYKRLDHARFTVPGSRTISGHALAILLRGVPTRRT
jgi:transposase